MGCDIHLFIEHRRDGDSPWEAHGKWRPLGAEKSAERVEYFDRAKYEQWHADGRSPHPDIVWAAIQPDSPELAESPISYDGRAYTLFAALAGVRNKDWGIVPIVAPRGLADDATREVRSEWARWGPDAHTASWVSLRELTLWEGWTQTFQDEVWVSEGNCERRLDDERFSWLTDAANWLGRLPERAPDAWNLSTRAWSSNPTNWRTLRYTARLDKNLGEDWWPFVAEVHRIGVLYGADNVRLVFWFDN